MDRPAKYTVILMSSLPKWACLAKGLRTIHFHRLWKSTDSLVALARVLGGRVNYGYRSLMALLFGSQRHYIRIQE